MEGWGGEEWSRVRVREGGGWCGVMEGGYGVMEGGGGGKQ